MAATTAGPSASAPSLIESHSSSTSCKFFGAEVVDEDFHARLVDIVAAAVLIVGAHDRLDVAEEITLRQEGLDRLADEGSASEAPTHDDLEARLAGAVAVHA